jgi:hypothetical protein
LERLDNGIVEGELACLDETHDLLGYSIWGSA